MLGLVMGYFRGFVDDVVGRFVEAFLALPLVVTGVIALVDARALEPDADHRRSGSCSRR